MIKQQANTIKAFADLKRQENKLLSTTKLAKQWHWKHHTKVLCFLKKLELEKLITRKSTKQGTIVKFN